MRTALPWILLALVAGGWIGSTFLGDDTPAGPLPAAGMTADASVQELAQLREEVGALRGELAALRAAQPQEEPGLVTKGSSPTTARTAPGRGEEFQRREAAARAQRAEQAAEEARRKAVFALRKRWYDAVRSLKDGAARQEALAEMREAFDGEDAERRLAALQLARWLGDVEYDRAGWRAAIEPHVRSEDPRERVAALIALAYVQPDARDVALWSGVVKAGDRNTAEEMSHAIVRTVDGVLRGPAAEAVLHLLREGTDIKKAFVMRGLQSVKEWDAAVEARLVEIVGAAPIHDYDSHYFFHFIAPRMDPKSDAVVDLLLDKLGAGQGSLDTIARGFRTGLDERQKQRAAEELLSMAEGASTAHALMALATALEHVVSARHVPRLEALRDQEGVDPPVRSALDGLVKAAQRRS